MVAAAVTQAAPIFNASAGPSVGIHGTGEGIGEKSKIDGVTTECKPAIGRGSAENGSSTVVLTPSYPKCTLTDTGLTLHVKPNGCGYHLALTDNLGGDLYRAHTKIICPTGTPDPDRSNRDLQRTHDRLAGNEGLTTVDVTNGSGDVLVQPTIEGVSAGPCSGGDKDWVFPPLSSQGVDTLAPDRVRTCALWACCK